MRSIRVLGWVVIAAAVAATGCWGDDDGPGGPTRVFGSGVVIEESRTADAVNRVDLAGIGDLTIVQGVAESLLVRAENNLVDHIRTTISGGTLRISTEPGYDLRPTRAIEYVLVVVDLDAVRLSGVGSVSSAEFATASLDVELSGVGDVTLERAVVDDLTVTLTGVGDVTLDDLDAGTLDVTQSGVGDIVGAGTVESQTVVVSGVGDYEAENLSSAVTTVTLETDGSATVRVDDVLTVTIRSSGSLYYYGDPVVHETITGTGDCVRLGP